MKNKIYIKFEDLDDLDKTLETFQRTYEVILTYYHRNCYHCFKLFMGLVILFVMEIYKEFGFGIKDIEELKEGGEENGEESINNP